jgi:hypothetical protein
MPRRLICSSVLFFALCGLGRAADDPSPAGTWKLGIPVRGGELILMIAFTEQDGKWVGDYLASSGKLPDDVSLKGLEVRGDKVRFALEIKGNEILSFDGRLSKEKKTIAGSLSLQGEVALTELRRTKLRRLDDPFAIAREKLEQVEGGPELFEAAMEVLAGAGNKKMSLEEVRAVLDRINKAAPMYGSRWDRELAIRSAEVLAGQERLKDLALEQVKRAEALVAEEEGITARIKHLETLSRIVKTAGKPEGASVYQAEIVRLEAKDYAAYVEKFPFKPDAFTGRKGKSDRAVLFEVFTGAECPPCAAADLAFDGLMKTYKPTDVVLLQYHLHVPGPDPLTSPDAVKRGEEYYREQVDGTPTVLVDGKVGPAGGGSTAAAQKRYEAFRKQIEESLEKPAGAQLGLTISKAEKGGYTGKATVKGLAAPGEKMTLRFALAEERIRYTGGNGIRYHHMVVRAMPGGPKGFPLVKKDSEQSVAFDPEALKGDLAKYLAGLAGMGKPLPHPGPPLELKNLKLIAFIQDDVTHEVIQSVQVDVGK